MGKPIKCSPGVFDFFECRLSLKLAMIKVTETYTEIIVVVLQTKQPKLICKTKHFKSGIGAGQKYCGSVSKFENPASLTLKRKNVLSEILKMFKKVIFYFKFSI